MSADVRDAGKDDLDAPPFLGLWAHNASLWPPVRTVWQQRMQPDAADDKIRAQGQCAMHLHDVNFNATNDKDAGRDEWAVCCEAEAAGTPAAGAGDRRKFKVIGHTFEWGPKVRRVYAAAGGLVDVCPPGLQCAQICYLPLHANANPQLSTARA